MLPFYKFTIISRRCQQACFCVLCSSVGLSVMIVFFTRASPCQSHRCFLLKLCVDDLECIQPKVLLLISGCLARRSPSPIPTSPLLSKYPTAMQLRLDVCNWPRSAYVPPIADLLNFDVTHSTRVSPLSFRSPRRNHNVALSDMFVCPITFAFKPPPPQIYYCVMDLLFQHRINRVVEDVCLFIRVRCRWCIILNDLQLVCVCHS